MMTDNSTPKAKPKDLSPMETFALVGELGFLIAVPAVVFGLGGAWLDREFGTTPTFILGGLALALVSSMLAVWHRIKPILNS